MAVSVDGSAFPKHDQNLMNSRKLSLEAWVMAKARSYKVIYPAFLSTHWLCRWRGWHCIRIGGSSDRGWCLCGCRTDPQKGIDRRLFSQLQRRHIQSRMKHDLDGATSMMDEWWLISDGHKNAICDDGWPKWRKQLHIFGGEKERRQIATTNIDSDWRKHTDKDR